MCTATGFKSRTCAHKWLTITKPCGTGKGFDSCHLHSFDGENAFLGGPKYFWAPANSCPECNKKGQYNGNVTRMVLGYGHGLDYGMRTSVLCCILM